ncbi:biliverdin-producing heme oxygenase [Marilutibacter spongiae]|uniref:Biliverdin-producing heme oxygenase n=1 Tax=Marilutibacter spongiae TaxID=2025720 RepID=A0A7W3TNC0_9GAMM|nr:biliverdin-producing heme oxygenase [Lysobacter spongiae]MBB1061493.1 biliverdin-producing heme oxygenase [Lysobacter spongiae]
MTERPPLSSAHELLRRTTSEAHSRVDALVGGGLASSEGYGIYLRGMHRFIQVSEARLAGHGVMLGVARDRLEQDLAALSFEPIRPAAPTSPEPDRVARLGWEYVVSGASVGARYLLRQAQQLGYSAEHGARFLAGHAGDPVWPRFLVRLASERFTPNELDTLRDAALDAFSAAESAFKTARQENVHG